MFRHKSRRRRCALQILKNESAFGTVTFAANARTVTAAQATSFAKGDVFTAVVSAPSSQDATAADLDVCLVATLIN